MLSHGQDFPDTYGKMSAWTDHKDALDWLKDGHGVPPGDTFLILEI